VNTSSLHTARTVQVTVTQPVVRHNSEGEGSPCDHQQMCSCIRSKLLFSVPLKYYLKKFTPSNSIRAFLFFCQRNPIYLQCVIIHSANGGKGEGWHVEEYSVALLC
jgi:hypothetical protein